MNLAFAMTPWAERLGAKSLESVGKPFLFRLFKNPQMQVESAKSRLRGRPQAFHLPFRQAILRVASRRIRSDILPRLRVGELARGVLE